jgi:propionyl-CoA carboxylase beta chain
MESKIEELNDKIAQAHLGGGKDRIKKTKKKLTARERVDYLMDEGSLKKLGIGNRTTDFGMAKELYYGDGVITGYGTINGRLVYVLLRFYRFGALSETHAEKICKVMDMAVKMGAPMIGLIQVAHVFKRVRSLWRYADIF